MLFLVALSSVMTEKQKYKVRVSRVDGHIVRIKGQFDHTLICVIALLCGRL